MRNSGEARTAFITTGDGDDGDDGNAAKDILDFVAQANDDWRELERRFSAEDLVQARDKHGSTALHYAAGSGALETCRFLLTRTVATTNVVPVDLTTIASTNTGRVALHWAARNGHTEICRLLVPVLTTPHNDNGNAVRNVDVQAKGQVTPLQLAMWQGHLETAQVLVCELGADPHFVNAWGCGVAHWLAKCPLSSLSSSSSNANSNNEKEDDDGSSSCSYHHHHQSHHLLWRCCHWLLEECGVAHNDPNHHGQTPLHKAAFAGNLAVVQYLVYQRNVQDNIRDHQGNSAADCAERSGKHGNFMATWIRRHASPIRTQALRLLGFWGDWTNNRQCIVNDSSPAVNTTPSAIGGCEEIHPAPPTLDELRSTYHRLAKQWHPDRQRNQRDVINTCTDHEKIVHVKNHNNNGNEPSSSWNSLQEAYQLLVDWWENPALYDAKVRLATRNAALHDYPTLLWLPEWHSSSSSSSKTIPQMASLQQGCHPAPPLILGLEERLAQFERRLISLLLTDAYRETGLSLAQLPKEYKKNWHNNDGDNDDNEGERRTMMMIDPKDYKCRKWSDLLRRRLASTIHVQVDPTGKQQPRVFARV